MREFKYDEAFFIDSRKIRIFYSDKHIIYLFEFLEKKLDIFWISSAMKFLDADMSKRL
jgi:hypothetical protein